MPSLIVENPGSAIAGKLVGRILIGRWHYNNIEIDDTSVSRIHAWIGVQDDRFYIADAASRTGTFVNGKLLEERHLLSDGDQIRVGPVTIHYRAESALPPGMDEIELTPPTPESLSDGLGIFMDCVCGAPLWLPRRFVGEGQCRYCGHVITQGVVDEAAAFKPSPIIAPRLAERAAAAPVRQQSVSGEMKRGENDVDDVDIVKDSLTKTRSSSFNERRLPPAVPSARPTSRDPGPVIPTVARAKPASPAISPTIKPLGGSPAPLPVSPPRSSAPASKSQKDQVCGICHAPITLFDEVSACPSCGLGFHADCWLENHGCSAYGCPQVNALGKDPK